MHARIPFPGGRILKRILPRSLLGRSLLMILMPLVLLQAVALQIFYGSHLDLVSRRLSAGITNEIAYTLDLLHQFPDEADRDWILYDAGERFDLQFRLDPGAVLRNIKQVNILGPMDDDLAAALRQTFTERFTADWVSTPGSVLPSELLTTVLSGRSSSRQGLPSACHWPTIGIVFSLILPERLQPPMATRPRIKTIIRNATSMLTGIPGPFLFHGALPVAGA